MPGGRPNKIQPTEFKNRIEKYLKECKEKDIVPLQLEFALLNGIDDETVSRYRLKREYSGALKRLNEFGEVHLQRKLEKTNQVAPMFLLKAKYGYSDRQQIDITSGNQPIGQFILPPRQTPR